VFFFLDGVVNGVDRAYARAVQQIGNWDKSLVSDDAKRGGVVVQAYSPLASGGLVPIYILFNAPFALLAAKK
jgi:hypothetical protein